MSLFRNLNLAGAAVTGVKVFSAGFGAALSGMVAGDTVSEDLAVTLATKLTVAALGAAIAGVAAFFTKIGSSPESDS